MTAMTKLEDYTAKSVASLAAAHAATNDTDRAFHHRAHGIWKRLIVDAVKAEERAAMVPPPLPRSKPIR
jgi:aromatic ring hydroxylase